MFSNASLASWIQANFEPAWESVRPVPRVTIDFRNGHRLERTLRGNIATYVCLADGSVVDVLAGLYDAPTYRRRLQEILGVARALTPLPRDQRRAQLGNYHRAGLTELRQPAAASEKARSLLALSKGRAERPVHVLSASKSVAESPALAVAGQALTLPASYIASIAQDAAQNERVRRPLVHALLQAGVPRTPAELTKQIYREVLHTDLDDPWLGLRDTLFEGYPFSK